jgi:hypothetical protein
MCWHARRGARFNEGQRLELSLLLFGVPSYANDPSEVLCLANMHVSRIGVLAVFSGKSSSEHHRSSTAAAAAL